MQLGMVQCSVGSVVVGVIQYSRGQCSAVHFIAEL